IGKPSDAQTVTVTNGSTAPVTIDSAITPGDFSRTATTCPAAGATLAPGGTCTISIVLTPTQAGPRSGTLTITPAGADVTAISVSLTGSGVAPNRGRTDCIN